MLNVNVTSTLMELYNVVKNNWMQDLNSMKDMSIKQMQTAVSPGYRRRSPFIPFELKNDTGSTLHFTTLITEMDRSFNSVDVHQPDEHWVKVAHGEVVPFSFRTRGMQIFMTCQTDNFIIIK